MVRGPGSSSKPVAESCQKRRLRLQRRLRLAAPTCSWFGLTICTPCPARCRRRRSLNLRPAPSSHKCQYLRGPGRPKSCQRKNPRHGHFHLLNLSCSADIYSLERQNNWFSLLQAKQAKSEVVVEPPTEEVEIEEEPLQCTPDAEEEALDGSDDEVEI